MSQHSTFLVCSAGTVLELKNVYYYHYGITKCVRALYHPKRTDCRSSLAMLAAALQLL